MEKKTVIDAVNELKGDLSRAAPSAGDSYLYWCHAPNPITRVLSLSAAYLADADYSLVCSTEELNQCIAEMSEGFEEYKREYETNKTVTVDGMVYEIGKLYCDGDGRIGSLKSAKPSESLPFVLKTTCSLSSTTWPCLSICVTGVESGAITPAPVELIDGEVYHFELNCDLWVGFYRESRKSFFTQLTGGNKICANTQAKQVDRLVPEVK